MNKEEYVANFNLEINNNVARLVSKIDDTISEVWKINKKDILTSLDWKQKEDNLIKYLEVKIKECEDTLERLEGTGSHRIPVLNARIYNYQDILERIKNRNYEWRN